MVYFCGLRLSGGGKRRTDEVVLRLRAAQQADQFQRLAAGRFDEGFLDTLRGFRTGRTFSFEPERDTRLLQLRAGIQRGREDVLVLLISRRRKYRPREANAMLASGRLESLNGFRRRVPTSGPGRCGFLVRR